MTNQKIPRMLIKRTIKEIEALKLNATKEERKKLNFNEFSPVSNERCIYGQMTGDCYSKRAGELISLSCTPAMMVDGLRDDGYEPAKQLKGGKAAIAFKKRTRAKGINFTHYHSPLEYFIANHREYNENILAYIKGTSKKLKLNDLLVSK